MSQSLSAMMYIRNNKHRIAVPVVSLCLCLVLTYLTGFLLSTTEISCASVYLESTQFMQFISLSDQSLGAKTTMDPSEIKKEISRRNEKTEEIAALLAQHDGIQTAYTANFLTAEISPAIGRADTFFPLLEKEELPSLLSYSGAALVEGRMPEKPGEIVIDRASMNNDGSELGGYYNYTNYLESYRIVGILDSDLYFGCGIPAEDQSDIKIIILISNIKDIAAELEKENIHPGTGDMIFDYNYGKEIMQNQIQNAISTSTSYMYGGVLIILLLLLMVIYTMYLRERHNEWCLYYSIGFSKMSIYLSAMRELLFTFGAAVLAGTAVIIVSVVLLKYFAIDPYGLKCRYFDMNSIQTILCSYSFLLGMLQIPVQYALSRIRTIDAMEDDLY